ncbi:hypothetical protein GS922_18900 [Rhodococcus hoagii]|nr:hypothetical protein [Prescottella equi]MBM4657390.1 hypothetical protein [Prescottella equi]MBM4720232.1 hypothetical protein [Prescottella equi]NKR22083.1 hypothetical protein [Prescottella equi]NKT51073.1 hypothetical protein [Prescottella equi]
MSTRDELANLIAQADSQEVGAMDPRTVGTMYGHLADAILAAGYSRPRVVETVEELQALPRGAVIRCPDGEIGLVMVTREKRHVVGYPGHLPTDELSAVDLPATVLHLPEETP